MLASAPQRARSDRFPAALNEASSVPSLLCRILVEPDEVTEGRGKLGVFGGTERINPQRVLEASDDSGDAERGEAGFQEHKTIGQRRRCLLLRCADLPRWRQ